MPRSERVQDGDVCGISRRWVLDATVASMLVSVEQQAQQIFSAEGIRWPGLFIISGHRSQAQQRQVNPSNPNSYHTRCPALAIDLRVGDIPASLTTFELWAFVGGLWKRQGGRWGGDFPTPDPNHFDVPTLDDPLNQLPIGRG